MKTLRSVAIASLVAVALVLLPAGQADAWGRHGGYHHGYHHGGIVIGLAAAAVGAAVALAEAPFVIASSVLGGPVYYRQPVYAAPAPGYYAPGYYAVPPATYYAPAAPAQAVWYYCPDTRSYYPYVRACPGGWQQVPARPAGN